MSTGSFPNANASFTYDSATIQTMQFELAIVGVTDELSLTGNGAYVLFAAPALCNVYATNFTVVTPGTGTGNVTTYKVAANNGANLSSNIAVGNVALVGANVQGNVTTTGPYTYNVNSTINVSQSGANTAAPGGITLQAGDLIIGVYTGNSGVIAAQTQYKLAPAAVVVA